MTFIEGWRRTPFRTVPVRSDGTISLKGFRQMVDDTEWAIGFGDDCLPFIATFQVWSLVAFVFYGWPIIILPILILALLQVHLIRCLQIMADAELPVMKSVLEHIEENLEVYRG